MASDHPSDPPAPAAPIVLRIKLRYEDAEVMVQRFAANVGKSGLFLPTKSLQPIGAEIKFELRLADETPVLVGLGRVKAATPPDPQRPRAAFGMAIELMRVTQQSRALILRMLERRRELGLAELGLPTAADIDAARRLESTNPGLRLPEHAPPVSPLAAVAPPIVAPAPLPIAPAPAEASPGDLLLTAPRRTTGPLAVAKVLAVAPLAPEPPRRRRAPIGEIIDRASGPVMAVAAVPGLDDEVDVVSALARARALAGSQLDADLDALSEQAAVPFAISIEAASAELARQLGGSAVRRDRSGHSTPPPMADQVAHSEPAAGEPAAVEPAATEPPPLDALPPEPASEASADAAEPAVELVTTDEQPAAAEPLAAAEAAEPPEIEPSQIADEIHQLNDFDLEDVEQTETRDIPEPASTFDPGYASTINIDQAALAARLEAQLAEAEAEAEADDLGLANAIGLAIDGELADDDAPLRPVLAGSDEDDEDDDGGVDERDDRYDDGAAGSPHDLSLEEIEDFEILAEADADDEDLLAAHAEHDAAPPVARRPVTRPPSELDFAARLDLDDESDPYFAPSEFATHHVEDSDLGEPVSTLPVVDPHLDSAGQALAAFELSDDAIDDSDEHIEPVLGVQPIFEPDASNSFTLAGPTDPPELDLPHAATQPVPIHRDPSPALRRDPPVQREPAFLRELPVHREPAANREPARPRASASQPSLYESPVEDHELEHALEALDVDLDDLSIPQASAPPRSIGTPTPRPNPVLQSAPAQPAARAPAATPSRPLRRTGGPTPASGRIVATLPKDDDVVIEFEEED